MKLLFQFKFLSAFIYIALYSCTFEQQDNTPLEMIRIDDFGDTISPWGTFTIALTTPLEDSAVVFNFSPDPGLVYSSSLNISKDTLMIIVSGILKGNTEYLIYPKNDLLGENGMVLTKEDAAFKIITAPFENEPNNNSLTADTLVDILYGVLNTKNDEDFYVISDSLISEVKLINHYKKSGISLYDSAMDFLSKNESFDDTLQEIFDTHTRLPLYVKVYSLIDSDSPRYQLEVR